MLPKHLLLSPLRNALRNALLFGAGCTFFAIASACSSSSPASSASPFDSGATPQQPASDASPDQPADDASVSDASTDADSGIGKCADTFGDKLTAAFGRLDGIVWAVQKPSDTQCVMPNSDHIIIQVLMGGAVYRMVANVQSDQGLPDGAPPPPVLYTTLSHSLPAPAFAEGWHTDGVALDYATDLGIHSDAFTPNLIDDLVAKVASEVKVGDPIAVYGTSGDGRPDSTHLIHRNGSKTDGAIVVSPTTTPKFLLFHFDEQVF